MRYRARSFLVVTIFMQSPICELGLCQLYARYGVPAARRQDDWRAVFIGPWWLRLTAAQAVSQDYSSRPSSMVRLSSK